MACGPFARTHNLGVFCSRRNFSQLSLLLLYEYRVSPLHPLTVLEGGRVVEGGLDSLSIGYPELGFKRTPLRIEIRYFSCWQTFRQKCTYLFQHFSARCRKKYKT